MAPLRRALAGVYFSCGDAAFRLAAAEADRADAAALRRRRRMEQAPSLECRGSTGAEQQRDLTAVTF